MRNIAVFIIKFYQINISPLYPGKCGFLPTCSNYGIEAISKYGVFRGGFLTFFRIVRCNPLNKGYYDPPENWYLKFARIFRTKG